MRVMAISDLHIDYDENNKWMNNLSLIEYKYDILILAGDLTDLPDDTETAFRELSRRFLHVLYIPGNHDLWVRRTDCADSLEKFRLIKQSANRYGIHMAPLHLDQLSIVPLYSWYDYSFGNPPSELFMRWADFMNCQWPAGFHEQEITDYFLGLNEDALDCRNTFIISFSHFLPRADLMPGFVPQSVKNLLPVMGAERLEKQIRKLSSRIHVYGHSHLNRDVVKDDVRYINNAFGYPYETNISKRQLMCVFEI